MTDLHGEGGLEVAVAGLGGTGVVVEDAGARDDVVEIAGCLGGGDVGRLQIAEGALAGAVSFRVWAGAFEACELATDLGGVVVGARGGVLGVGDAAGVVPLGVRGRGSAEDQVSPEAAALGGELCGRLADEVGDLGCMEEFVDLVALGEPTARKCFVCDPSLSRSSADGGGGDGAVPAVSVVASGWASSEPGDEVRGWVEAGGPADRVG
ncbi:MAG: hypothetical protein ACRDZ1_00035 [Acidimicrobiia bacterium]